LSWIFRRFSPPHANRFLRVRARAGATPVGSDARISVEGVTYEVDPDLAGEELILWWGLFDRDLYVEHGERRYGPYVPIGGPIPLHRYRRMHKTRSEERADRVAVLAAVRPAAGRSRWRR
jgi:hypothetical protein